MRRSTRRSRGWSTPTTLSRSTSTWVELITQVKRCRSSSTLRRMPAQSSSLNLLSTLWSTTWSPHISLLETQTTKLWLTQCLRSKGLTLFLQTTGRRLRSKKIGWEEPTGFMANLLKSMSQSSIRVSWAQATKQKNSTRPSKLWRVWSAEFRKVQLWRRKQTRTPTKRSKTQFTRSLAVQTPPTLLRWKNRSWNWLGLISRWATRRVITNRCKVLSTIRSLSTTFTISSIREQCWIKTWRLISQMALALKRRFQTQCTLVLCPIRAWQTQLIKISSREWATTLFSARTRISTSIGRRPLLATMLKSRHNGRNLSGRTWTTLIS